MEDGHETLPERTPGGTLLISGDGQDITMRGFINRYCRMCGTVIVSSVARMFLDSIGIVAAGLTPKQVGFWFGHCQDNFLCVIIGLSEFIIAWLAMSFFVWRYHEIVTDPACNRWATFLSWQVIVGAAEWLPMSVMVGKVNIIVEYNAWGISTVLLRPLSVMCVTVLFSYLAYFVMTKTQNTFPPGSYIPFAALHLIYCLGFATGFSWWTLVRGVMDFFPDWDLLQLIFCFLIIGAASQFYLKYGPEPIIPRIDAGAQVKSVKRSIRSFLVYSAMILVVMALVEPGHGILKKLASQFHDYEFPDQLDFLALFEILLMAVFMVFFGSALSFTIAQKLQIDSASSISISRSQMVSQMDRTALRGQVLSSQEQDLMANRADGDGDRNGVNDFQVIDLDMDVEASTPSSPDMAAGVGFAQPERQFSKLECLSVLTYDTLSFCCGSLCAYLILGVFAVFADGYVSTHPWLYILSAFLYFVLFLLIVGRVTRVYFPTPVEKLENEEVFQRADNALEGPSNWSRNARGQLMGDISIPIDIEMQDSSLNLSNNN